MAATTWTQGKGYITLKYSQAAQSCSLACLKLLAQTNASVSPLVMLLHFVDLDVCFPVTEKHLKCAMFVCKKCELKGFIYSFSIFRENNIRYRVSASKASRFFAVYVL